jgi:hypothetical protein
MDFRKVKKWIWLYGFLAKDLDHSSILCPKSPKNKIKTAFGGEIKFGSQVHMLLYQKIIIGSVENNLHVHLHNISEFSKYHEKPILFLLYV